MFSLHQINDAQLSILINSWAWLVCLGVPRSKDINHFFVTMPGFFFPVITDLGFGLPLFAFICWAHVTSSKRSFGWWQSAFCSVTFCACRQSCPRARRRTVFCVHVCDASCVYTMYVRLAVTDAALVNMMLKAKTSWLVMWSWLKKKGAFRWQLATFSTKHRAAFSGHH